MSVTKEQVFEFIDNMTIIDMSEFIKEFEERSILKDLPVKADLKTRIERLISDYERAVKRATLIVQLAESNGDVKTADLLTERIGVYEENAWMLRATIAS